MPLYELSMIVRSMPKAGLIKTVQRISENILDQGGYLRKIENLGNRELPYRMSAHGRMHTKGSYFLIHFDAPPATIDPICDNCNRDIDLVRRFLQKVEEPPTFQCTRHEEIKPPAYRAEVQKMIAEASSRVPIHQRKKFKFNTGLDYYPFGH
ncbi:small ribosomal subunit protein bS6m-like isoform X2 [Macrobrachium nipponense]|uniref:small ribosomal subunit protein bS6m-like isoform X2 n=1 Tax=Macrobrachium nipponense TaxID=159736 RepID=UPI0030C7E811